MVSIHKHSNAFQLLLLPFLFTSVSSRVLIEGRNPNCQPIDVFISVSPLGSSKEGAFRQIELSWIWGEGQPGDVVALYDQSPIPFLRRPLYQDRPVPQAPPYRGYDPGARSVGYGQPEGAYPPTGNPQDAGGRTLDPLATVQTGGDRAGWRGTGVKEKHESSSSLGYTPRCLGYWVTYERPVQGSNDTFEVLALTCLRTRPRWMRRMSGDIGSRQLSDVFFVGTHDSGSYEENYKSNIVSRYSVTQDESVLGQLIYGARYIDLRVGYYPNREDKWWANHGVVKMVPLQSVLSDLKAFLSNTDEIVILDVQEFPVGFNQNENVHVELVRFLEKELGEHLASRDDLGWSSTLDQVWARGRRLILAYDKGEILRFSRLLWPAVRQLWADARKDEDLAKFVARIADRPPRNLAWALMAQLTPDARYIASHPTDSLRKLASTTNRAVTTWAAGPLGSSLHVLAVDFMRSLPVVETSLIWNQRRSGQPECRARALIHVPDS